MKKKPELTITLKLSELRRLESEATRIAISGEQNSPWHYGMAYAYRKLANRIKPKTRRVSGANMDRAGKEAVELYRK